MSALRRRWSWLLLAMVVSTTSLAVLMRAPRREQAFHVPSHAEFVRARALFDRALSDQTGENAQDDLSLGLVRERMMEPPGFSLSEPDGKCAGRGTYLVRSDPVVFPVALVAPHRGADRDTGTIAAELFRTSPFAAAAWNSAPRQGPSECDFAGDVARQPTHFITAFSLAFAGRYPSGRLVQLHGFDQTLRKTDIARTAEVVLSNGSNRPDESLLALSDCLERLLPGKIAIYPLDTDELGATRNEQGRALRAIGFRGFVHLEMSAPLRRRLVSEAALRDAFATCLGAEP